MAEQSDRLLAVLDGGWDALEDGDSDKAARAAKKALGVDRRCAEAHALLGATHVARGKPDEALASYRRALEIEPDSPDALLRTAETLFDWFDDFEQAADLAARALEHAEDATERADASLLRAEALLQLGQDDEARRALESLPRKLPDDPGFLVRLGAAWLDLDEPGRARRPVEAAVAADPEFADAHHTMGLVHEKRGDLAAMVESFRRVREMDLREPPPEWGLSKDEFERVAEKALMELPESVRKRLANVPILASDYPSLELIAEGCDPRMMGFFSGVPYPEKSNVGGAPHLDCIFLYQRNIERFARSRNETIDEIRKTLLHETGHFFALDEDALAELGLD